MPPGIGRPHPLGGLRTAALATVVTASLACGSSAPSDRADAGLPPPDAGACDEATTGRYMPLVQGARWTYVVTDLTDGTKTSKTQSVGALEDVGGGKTGVRAHRVTTDKDGGTVVSWQADTGTAIVRHREMDMAGSTQGDELYQPYKLRIDDSAARTTVGAMYHEDYSEVATDDTGSMTTTAKGEDWIVEAIGELTTVPAGDFCTMRVRRVATANGVQTSDKRYWFARGVGKVREQSAARLEELASVQLPTGGAR